MATYYVRTTGSDANNGTSAATAWATINKVVGSGSTVVAGDTVWIGAGTYREVNDFNMTNPASTVTIKGDVTGGNTGDSGLVIITAYTTNDTTAPGSTTLHLQQTDNITFEDIIVIGGTNACFSQALDALNITWRRCVFKTSCNAKLGYIESSGAVTQNWLFENCIFDNYTGDAGIFITCRKGSVADYDIGIEFRNCLIMQGGYNFCVITDGGSGSFYGGGTKFINCTSIVGGALIVTASSLLSTSIPCKVYNSLVKSGVDAAIYATSLGQIVEDYNIIMSQNARNNVTAGTHTIASNTYAPTYSIGEEFLYNMFPRPMFSPLPGSNLLGFGNDATYTTSADFLGAPRPSGGATTTKGIGYIERGNTAIKETSVVRTGSNSIKIIGPGYQDFLIPVDAVSTTVSVYGYYDTNHGTTNKPQLTILNAEEVGVTSSTATMTATTTTWQQISVTFTPNKKGIITARVISRAAAGNGYACFDDFGIS